MKELKFKQTVCDYLNSLKTDEEVDIEQLNNIITNAFNPVFKFGFTSASSHKIESITSNNRTIYYLLESKS